MVKKMNAKIATYYYPEATVDLSIVRGRLVLSDSSGLAPYCGPLRARREMNTSAPVGVSVPSYDEVGLFYGYSMPGVGWG